MTDKSVLELAVDLAFVQMEQDLIRRHKDALDSLLERVAQLRKEVELIHTAEASNAQ